MSTRIRFLAAFAAIVPIVTSGSALAQSYSSFTGVDGIYGINVQQSGLTYTVSLDPGAFVMLGGNQFDITDIFGFWNLRPGSFAASGQPQNGWNWDASSNGSGAIAGWHNPDKSFDIQAGGQKSFTYDSLDQSDLEGYGFHVTFVQTWNGGNTGFVKGPLNPVPEPATLACLALGAFAVARRRRR